LYNPLFNRPDPDPGAFAAQIDPNSLEVLAETRVEPALAALKTGEAVQFERQGYFCLDPDAKPGRLIVNRTVGLRDTWAKVEAKAAASG
jgi:glutaminyl-tRNA synthetase